MIENITTILNASKDHYDELMLNFAYLLPNEIVSGAKMNYDDDLPNLFNQLLFYTNNCVGTAHKVVENVEQAIEFLRDKKDFADQLKQTYEMNKSFGYSPYLSREVNGAEMIDKTISDMNGRLSSIYTVLLLGQMKKERK